MNTTTGTNNQRELTDNHNEAVLRAMTMNHNESTLGGLNLGNHNETVLPAAAGWSRRGSGCLPFFQG